MAGTFKILISSFLLFMADGFLPYTLFRNGAWYQRKDVFTTDATTLTNNDVDEIADDLLHEIDVVFLQQFAELNDSQEADMIRKCDEADRTGQIAECASVRKFSDC